MRNKNIKKECNNMKKNYRKLVDKYIKLKQKKEMKNLIFKKIYNNYVMN